MKTVSGLREGALVEFGLGLTEAGTFRGDELYELDHAVGTTRFKRAIGLCLGRSSFRPGWWSVLVKGRLVTVDLDDCEGFVTDDTVVISWDDDGL